MVEMVELLIYSPPKCAVGKWNLKFDAVYVDDDVKLYPCPQTRLLLHKHTYCSMHGVKVSYHFLELYDAVYMKDETWRKEYVLNDTGKIYTGNYKQIYGRPWNFGQFESISLETALYVLNELTKIPITFRGSPTLISRKMSALVNSSDDNGILTGRWDGEYSDGVSPTKWTGSVAILQKYMETKQPVEYGQCWVFSGVMTTVCRALGIPTRSVTNFASAHDTDGSLTIDMHWDENEEHMPELDTDSVWNFHVWNECWMTRPDLQEGYGGWQAVDATPQETSDGIYCAGPASLVAIKNGNVGVTFDTPFIFAEVNADKVHWVKQKDGSVEKLFERRVVGKKISTKRAGSSRDFSVDMWNPDREDITDQYKYPEGHQRSELRFGEPMRCQQNQLLIKRVIVKRT
ncbi:F13A1 [Bugula neritina]|uniref:protein-glutamine gamma-glutamyltransferase n=1 Tax=Bugula neritina TaxID=10212 RepID=A0A7J7J7Q8_BUGNE|nr:F13A1 [Bugula neritina]